MRYQSKGPSLTIANGATDSNEIDIPPHVVGVKVACQETELTGAVVIQTSDDGGTSWQTLQSGGSNVEVGAAEATTVSPIIGDMLRLQADPAEAAERNFQVYWIDES